MSTYSVALLDTVLYTTHMIIGHGELLKTLRLKRGISQLEIARRLDISRSSYIAIEQGKRELTLGEFEKLSNILNVSFEEIESGVLANYEKYKQMILAYLKVAGGNDGKIPKTKLAKLLYLADFAWFYDKLESMSGMHYARRAYGPVPDSYFRALTELEEDGKIRIDHKGDAVLVSICDGAARQKLDLLKNNELELMQKISKKWKDKRTSEIVNFTHEQLPYRICRENELIPYELIVQEDPDNVY